MNMADNATNRQSRLLLLDDLVRAYPSELGRVRNPSSQDGRVLSRMSRMFQMSRTSRTSGTSRTKSPAPETLEMFCFWLLNSRAEQTFLEVLLVSEDDDVADRTALFRNFHCSMRSILVFDCSMKVSRVKALHALLVGMDEELYDAHHVTRYLSYAAQNLPAYITALYIDPDAIDAELYDLASFYVTLSYEPVKRGVVLVLIEILDLTLQQVVPQNRMVLLPFMDKVLAFIESEVEPLEDVLSENDISRMAEVSKAVYAEVHGRYGNETGRSKPHTHTHTRQRYHKGGDSTASHQQHKKDMERERKSVINDMYASLQFWDNVLTNRNNVDLKYIGDAIETRNFSNSELKKEVDRLDKTRHEFETLRREIRRIRAEHDDDETKKEERLSKLDSKRQAKKNQAVQYFIRISNYLSSQPSTTNGGTPPSPTTHSPGDNVDNTSNTVHIRGNGDVPIEEEEEEEGDGRAVVSQNKLERLKRKLSAMQEDTKIQVEQVVIWITKTFGEFAESNPERLERILDKLPLAKAGPNTGDFDSLKRTIRELFESSSRRERQLPGVNEEEGVEQQQEEGRELERFMQKISTLGHHTKNRIQQAVTQLVNMLDKMAKSNPPHLERIVAKLPLAEAGPNMGDFDSLKRAIRELFESLKTRQTAPEQDPNPFQGKYRMYMDDVLRFTTDTMSRCEEHGEDGGTDSYAKVVPETTTPNERGIGFDFFLLALARAGEVAFKTWGDIPDRKQGPQDCFRKLVETVIRKRLPTIDAVPTSAKSTDSAVTIQDDSPSVMVGAYDDDDDDEEEDANFDRTIDENLKAFAQFVIEKAEQKRVMRTDTNFAWLVVPVAQCFLRFFFVDVEKTSNRLRIVTSMLVRLQKVGIPVVVRTTDEKNDSRSSSALVDDRLFALQKLIDAASEMKLTFEEDKPKLVNSLLRLHDYLPVGGNPRTKQKIRQDIEALSTKTGLSKNVSAAFISSAPDLAKASDDSGFAEKKRTSVEAIGSFGKRGVDGVSSALSGLMRKGWTKESTSSMKKDIDEMRTQFGENRVGFIVEERRYLLDVRTNTEKMLSTSDVPSSNKNGAAPNTNFSAMKLHWNEDHAFTVITYHHMNSEILAYMQSDSQQKQPALFQLHRSFQLHALVEFMTTMDYVNDEITKFGKLSATWRFLKTKNEYDPGELLHTQEEIDRTVLRMELRLYRLLGYTRDGKVPEDDRLVQAPRAANEGASDVSDVSDLSRMAHVSLPPNSNTGPGSSATSRLDIDVISPDNGYGVHGIEVVSPNMEADGDDGGMSMDVDVVSPTMRGGNYDMDNKNLVFARSRRVDEEQVSARVRNNKFGGDTMRIVKQKDAELRQALFKFQNTLAEITGTDTLDPGAGVRGNEEDQTYVDNTRDRLASMKTFLSSQVFAYVRNIEKVRNLPGSDGKRMDDSNPFAKGSWEDNKKTHDTLRSGGSTVPGVKNTDLIMGMYKADFVVLYVFKAFRLLVMVGCLGVAQKVFQDSYIKRVHAQKRDPPPLYNQLLMLLSFESIVMLLVLMALVAASFLFKSPSDTFVIDDDLLMTLLVDSLFTTLFILFMGVLIARVMHRKRYFVYKYHGLTTSRAYADIMLVVVGVFSMLPYTFMFHL